MKAKVLFIVLWSISAALIILSVTIELQRKSDEQLVQSMNRASQKISDYVQKQSRLPESLAEAGFNEAGISYGQESASIYELCAVFKQRTKYYSKSDYLNSQLYVSIHDKGRQCFKAQPTRLKEKTVKVNATSNLTSIFSQANNSQDIERQTDIKAIHGQLEAYYATSGRYPLLSDLNSPTWRAKNMKGLDREALKDPTGSSYSLELFASKNVYSYEVKNAQTSMCLRAEETCDSYTLVATLSTGQKYTKSSLN